MRPDEVQLGFVTIACSKTASGAGVADGTQQTTSAPPPGVSNPYLETLLDPRVPNGRYTSTDLERYMKRFAKGDAA